MLACPPRAAAPSESFYFVTSIATLLASVATALWDRFGAPLPFAIAAALAFVAAAMLVMREVGSAPTAQITQNV